MIKTIGAATAMAKNGVSLKKRKIKAAAEAPAKVVKETHKKSDFQTGKICRRAVKPIAVATAAVFKIKYKIEHKPSARKKLVMSTVVASRGGEIPCS